MTNSIILSGAGTGLISREDLVRSLNNTAREIPVNGNGLPYLKMDKDNGDWIYGQEETSVEEGSLWAANPATLKKGWVAWDRNNVGAPPVSEVMVPFTRDLPPAASLAPLGMSTPNKKTGQIEQLVYQQQYSVEFVCVTGEDEGVVVEYKQSSGGALKLFGDLTNAIISHAEKGDDIVPLGEFKFEKYKNKTYGGNTLNPIFEVVEWRTMDDTSPAAAGTATKAPEAKAEDPPARTRTRTAAAPAVEADVSTEAEEAELAAEYEAAAAKAEAPADAPRRRVRR